MRWKAHIRRVSGHAILGTISACECGPALELFIRDLVPKKMWGVHQKPELGLRFGFHALRHACSLRAGLRLPESGGPGATRGGKNQAESNQCKLSKPCSARLKTTPGLAAQIGR